MLRSLVPAVAFWLEEHEKVVAKKSRYCGQAEAQYSRLKSWVDAFTIAHLGVTEVICSIGRGQTFKTPINTIQANIGRKIEDQAFIEYMRMVDPFRFTKLEKRYLHDPIRRADKKRYVMQYILERTEGMEWDFMKEEDLIRVGALVLRAVMSIPCNRQNKEGFFEKRSVQVNKKKSVAYLGYTLSGMRYRDKLQAMADEITYQPLPMVCPPLPWSLEERGGFLLPPPVEYGELVHGRSNTEPSDTAIDALNRLQSQPFRINPFILDLQLELLKKSWEIGTFRSFESTSWKDEHFPLYSSEYIASLEKGSDQYRKVMKELTEAYHNQKLCENQAINPRRIVKQAESLRDEVFYTPYFFDTRLRMYPACELSMTSGDAVKALLVTAEPKPINDDTRRELLIAIATSADIDKVSKADYFTRLQWAEEFVKTPEFLECVTDPVNCNFWKEEFDEKFQCLSYCEEFWALFITGERDTTRVFIGKDQTCSGIQIMSSWTGDITAATATNVVPSDEPRDAYGVVAKKAQELLQDKSWLKTKLEMREEKRQAWNQKNPDNQREERNIFECDVDKIDRSILKTSVLVRGYGGTHQARRRYVLDALEEKGVEIHPQDKGIVVAACLDAMDLCFPQYKELNDWFKRVAMAACRAGKEEITWITPNGSKITQNYNTPLFTVTDTHLASGGHYAQLMVDAKGQSYIQTGWGDVKASKHASAIAANFVHSAGDATCMQNAVTKIPEDVNIQTVHDCYYSTPSEINSLGPIFRQAFYGVVTTPVLQNLLEENDIEDIGLPEMQPFDASVCLQSPYLFC